MQIHPFTCWFWRAHSWLKRGILGGDRPELRFARGIGYPI
jgi:hypothetical protein